MHVGHAEKTSLLKKSTIGKQGPARRIARSTKRPAERAMKGTVKLENQINRIGPEEFKQRAQLDEEQMHMLDEIARGRAPRNSQAILGAIALKASYAYEKPKQSIEHQGADITFEIQVAPPPAIPAEYSVLSTPAEQAALPPRVVEAKAPIVRRKSRD